MAGRGTDIMLGGNAEFLAVAAMESKGLDAREDPEAYEAAWPEVLAGVEAQVEEEAAEVREAGGLYVLGTERHESRRIDNQLMGRSGRQGDPGDSRFYLSLTDDLMRLFGSGAAERIMTIANVPDDMPLETKMVSRAIQSAQNQVEERNAEQRKNVLKYDDVLNRQRTVIYDERRRVLEGADLAQQVQDFRDEVLNAYVTAATQGPPDSWKLDDLFEAVGRLYTPSFTAEELVEDAGGSVARDTLRTEILTDANLFYERREETLGEDATRELERRVMLSVIDRRWREHLYEMDYLKNGIGLRAMAQRDPLVEYQREGYEMFVAMQEGIREDVVRLTNTLEVTVREKPAVGAGGAQLGAAAAPDAGVTVEADELKPKKQQLHLSAPDESGGTAESHDESEAPAPANRAQRRKKRNGS
jgi:preprotein translocase subunit SecA